MKTIYLIFSLGFRENPWLKMEKAEQKDNLCSMLLLYIAISTLEVF